MLTRRFHLAHLVQLAGLACAAAGGGCPAQAAPVTPAGERLAAVLDSLDVEQHWPAGVHIHWQTGVPDGKPEKMPGHHTHCSALAAAAAQRLGVYLLRPPEHGQLLLANAQNEWLAGADARQRGWRPVSDGLQAQALANQGQLVLASYHNHHDDKPGHIAIVRPSDKPEARILSEGPQVTQAGDSNYRSTDLRRGFAGHPAAWTRSEVQYYAHSLE